MKIRKNSQGFSAVEALFILFIIGILGFGGWWVWHSQSTKEPVPNTSNTSSDKAKAKTKEIAKKTYTNDEYGFSFNYPENWNLSTDLSDIDRGHLEGDIVVASPNGTKVHFGPNLGGKGGDCWDDEADARTARTCQTVNILSVEQLSGTQARPVYYTTGSTRSSDQEGGKTTYFVDLDSHAEYSPVVGSFLAAIYGVAQINSAKISGANINIRIEGNDDSSTAKFFDSTESKEASSILKTFRLLD